ncbi:MAG: SUF system NifU family Fe-S cluster assembly protein [Myxococcales bacterium]|nr:SUF system NifU family Fe-S cluster assembly protein [Myxococcales bacterium]
MDLRELYQEVILDHNRNPRNFREMDGATHHAEGYNPLCGDQVSIYLHIDGGTVSDISFKGQGCAISTASASVMTQTLKGKSVAEAEQIFEDFRRLVTGEAPKNPDGLGKLAVFSGVKEYPARVKCASLCWHALHNAMAGSGETAVTE